MIETATAALERARAYPALRYMGSKGRLLPWIHDELAGLDFDTALDPFCGSGCVAYLLKAMGKSVTASDFLLFPSVVAAATVANSEQRLDDADLAALLAPADAPGTVAASTFGGIFYGPDDLAFVDRVWANLGRLASGHRRDIALAALIRSCLKRQPRGVFTVRGGRYADGRRDLGLTLAEHFTEQVAVYNATVLDTGRRCAARRADALAEPDGSRDPAPDLVYLDPPYVPRADDNDYVKRYHFVEGLASYWQDPDATPSPDSLVRKIPKRYTPFSYRRTALEAFDRLFRRFAGSTIVLSYGSNGFPDLGTLVARLEEQSASVRVAERGHRYHFGTHARVNRALAREYLVVARP